MSHLLLHKTHKKKMTRDGNVPVLTNLDNYGWPNIGQCIVQSPDSVLGVRVDHLFFEWPSVTGVVAQAL